MFKYAMVCHMDNFDSTKLAIFLLIQIWEGALNWFIVDPIHEQKLDMCHQYDLGATYPKHVLLLIPMCKWFPIDMNICMTLKCNIF